MFLKISNSGSNIFNVIDGFGKIAPSRTVANVGSAKFKSENDSYANDISSPQTSRANLLRCAHEIYLDSFEFNDGSQNTGKFNYNTSTITVDWTKVGCAIFNNGSSAAAQVGALVVTSEGYPLRYGVTTYFTFFAGISNHVPDFTDISFGAGITTTTLEPLSGIFFRINSDGVQGVVQRNTSTGSGTAAQGFSHQTKPFVGLDLTPGLIYKFVIAIESDTVQFWVNDVLYDTIVSRTGGSPILCQTPRVFFRHANPSTVANPAYAMQSIWRKYQVSQSIGYVAMTRSDFLGRTVNNYYSSAGGGGLQTYANSANPTAAVPANATLTANLLANAGGQEFETDTLAITTDGLLASLQIGGSVATTLSKKFRRLKVNGVRIDSFVQAALTGGGYVASWSLAFDGTAVSLAQTETVNTRSHRKIPLGFQTVAANAALNVMLGSIDITFQNPIYISSGNFISIARKKIGTAPSAGTLAHLIHIDCSWE